MGYTFDGPNKKIQLTAGTIFVDVADMYSRWVDWFVTGDNSKYLRAMRNIGGDPISDVKNLGLTFFLTNGWRIVPQSADHRLTLEGNLVTEPSGFSPVDTVPGYSIIVEYSVSNLVDSMLAGSGLSSDEHDKLMALPDDTMTSEEHAKLFNVAGDVWAEDNGQFLIDVIRNKKVLEKQGGTWYLLIKNVAGTADIVKKALKDKDGNNINDIDAGVLAQELQSII